jgi:hypothetical protein
MPDTTIESFGRWLERLCCMEDNDEAQVEGLFSADAAYYLDPFREPTLGQGGSNSVELTTVVVVN